MPRIKDFSFQIVSTNEQADELVRNGFYDFRDYFVNDSRNLDKGAVAFCVFIGRELAYKNWVAMTDEAKKTFDSIPYRVDFSKKEACIGGTVTVPKYRGKGLMAYGYFKSFQFLRGRGIEISRNAVDIKNIASQKAHAKFNPKIYAKGRYIRILRWNFWKETPIAIK